MRPKRQRPDSIPTRPSLLGRLKDWEDQDSWKEFHVLYGGLIQRFSLKAGLTAEEANDALQETLLSVAKQLPGFRYDPQKGSFKSWLLQIARRRVADQFRLRKPHQRRNPNDATTDGLEDLPSPEGSSLDKIWEEEWHQNLLGLAREKVKCQVSARQFQMYDLFVFQGWPIAEITRTLRVNAAQIYMAKYRVGSLLKKEIRSLETRYL